MIKLIFLGTGGGRFAMITQKRRTGGIRIILNELNAHLDPGPGALIYSLQERLDPQKINAILVSHSHPDHTNDAEVLIEAMSRGTVKKRGLLAASHSVLYGNDVCEQSISNYHQKIPEKVVDAKVGTIFNIGDIEVYTTEARHSDPDAVGFRFETREFGTFAYMPDSEYFEGVKKFYEKARLLILSVLRPSGKPWKGHMATDNAIKIIEETHPDMAVITHFGMEMIFRGPNREAEIIQQRTGVPTLAAVDGMHISIDNEIQVGKTKKQADLGSFMGLSSR